MPSAEQLLSELFPEDAPCGALRTQIQAVTLPAGQSVFRRGEPCRNYLVVLSGSVRVQALSSGGREVTLYRVRDGESCVITTSCLISHEAYPAEGMTETETHALVIPRALFDQAMDCSAAFRRFVFANQGQRLADLIRRLEDVAFGRVEARLARLLVDRSRADGDQVILTHQQIAAELGTAREVVSRQLKRLEQAGWVRVGRGAIEVCDRQALLALGAAGGA